MSTPPEAAPSASQPLHESGKPVAGGSAWATAGRYAAMGSAIAILISIPASQILLGVALLCVLVGRIRLPWPRVWIPLGLFVAWFFVSLAFSPEPSVALPQVKKFYVFLMLPVAMAALRGAGDFLRVAVGWAPYRYGRWTWVDWYGWTWVSYDSWGWAPYHYGRWYHHA